MLHRKAQLPVPGPTIASALPSPSSSSITSLLAITRSSVGIIVEAGVGEEAMVGVISHVGIGNGDVLPSQKFLS